jgi:putative nucleotidyltransferase with HDIG domain
MTESVENFKKRLAQIKEISTLPHVMTKIMEIITDENSSAIDLAEEIAKDASLTAKILKMVNSAYYGFYREIAKVSDAVVVLGFNEIRRISLAISVIEIFGSQSEDRRLEFWNHSFTCAAMSDILAKKYSLQEHGAFTAGLLHDIGKSILDQYFNDMFMEVREHMQEHSMSAHEAEQALYGFDHADIGYWLSERWNLPVTLGEAIRCHHRPESAVELPELAQTVHLADKLTIEFTREKAGLAPETPDAEGDIQKDGLTPIEKSEALSELEERIKDSTLTVFLK